MSRGKEQEYISGGKEVSSSKAEHKNQGTSANTGSRGRSVGSEYAMAVDTVKEAAKAMRGSQTAFLGKDKVALDAKELPGSNVMYKGKKKKK